ncbi:MAG: archease [Candidatus Nitrosocaldus sp.]|nr:archease [Candidatus Nitrosocaldus sp.]MDW8000830.1 archease [Candidatus Nitrosocaldus sp.]
MGYRMLEHMTDALVEVDADTLEQGFALAARALVDVMIDVSRVEERLEVELQAEGHDLESLLYNWLEQVMIALVSDHTAMSRFDVRVERDGDAYALRARAYGEPLDLEKHHYKVEIKGVTYHMMSIERAEDGRYRLRFLLDL